MIFPAFFHRQVGAIGGDEPSWDGLCVLAKQEGERNRAMKALVNR